MFTWGLLGSPTTHNVTKNQPNVPLELCTSEEVKAQKHQIVVFTDEPSIGLQRPEGFPEDGLKTIDMSYLTEPDGWHTTITTLDII